MLSRRGVIGCLPAAFALAGRKAALAAGPKETMAMSLHVPEESEPHLRTFMQWPASREVHDDPDFLDDLQRAIARIANTIADFEPVVMLAATEQHASARRRLSSKVELWPIPTQDLWCRDSGPLFAFDNAGRQVVSHIRFNGWGNKQDHRIDARIAEAVAARLGIPVIDHGLVGEAGGAEYDGEGTVLAHESSWINPNRNAGNKDDVTRRLLAAYGAKTVIWAPGIKGADITDYHIDALARFVRPGVVLIQLPRAINPADPWSKAAYQTRDILQGASDAHGRKLKIETIWEPENPRVRDADFVASYVNYYVCNNAVIAAQFGDREADAAAQASFKRLFPGREIVMLNVDAVGEAGGGIHCATQQQPRERGPR